MTVRTAIWRNGRGWRRVVLSLAVGSGFACTGTDSGLPPEVRDPAAFQTPAGAMARYRGALATLPQAFDRFLTETGILTDELADLPTPVFISAAYTGIDSRTDLSNFDQIYTQLHEIRKQAREARGFVETYAPDSSASLAGHLYALEGYAELFLADLFCSGIPLSTVDFGADYTLAEGSSTADVYSHAVELFDSALGRASDSARVQAFAAVGRGRALLALGRYAEAAEAVAAVPDGYAYQVVAGGAGPQRLLALFGESSGQSQWGYTNHNATPSVGDHEGGNGLDYRTSNDPRTPTVALPGMDPYHNTMYFPAKYLVAQVPDTLTVADGIEARLIEAEAALQANDTATWLAKLNALRTDGTYDVTATTPPDTLWHAGTGGIAGLAPLDDPGTTPAPNARIDLLFRERAFWLYLTGHRQGDLRRLIRQYGRASDAVYPTGGYPGGSGSYGHEVVAPVPPSEQQLNPKYTGCLDHNA